MENEEFIKLLRPIKEPRLLSVKELLFIDKTINDLHKNNLKLEKTISILLDYCETVTNLTNELGVKLKANL